jgi:hypothetical protein
VGTLSFCCFATSGCGLLMLTTTDVYAVAADAASVVAASADAATDVQLQQ